MLHIRNFLKWFHIRTVSFTDKMIHRINFRNKMKVIRCYNRIILIPNFNRNCFLFQEFNQTLQSISDYKVKMPEKLWNYTINYSSRTKLQSHWFLQQHPEAKIHKLKHQNLVKHSEPWKISHHLSTTLIESLSCQLV